jgi:hypothetical protein
LNRFITQVPSGASGALNLWFDVTPAMPKRLVNNEETQWLGHDFDHFDGSL